MALFTEAEMHEMGQSPDVARTWLLEADLAAGTYYYVKGTGTLTLDGHDWTGVDDPAGGQFVALGAVDASRFPQATAIQITIAAPSYAFMRSIHENARDIEGRAATLYWAMFNPETEKIIGTKKRVVTGSLSRPHRHASARTGARLITINLEGPWLAKNHPFGGQFTDGWHQREWPGDKYFEYAGTEVVEPWE
ncbi:MAG: hypothetical protein K8H74_17845 [Notoacmeibacter sp.]|nr:hypothetical protein [Notoacmeibacter sp.]